MFLDQAQIEQTPLMWTIIGWVVSFITAVVAAIIPSVISYKRDKSLKQEILDMRKAQATSVDKSKFFDQKQALIKSLDEWQNKLQEEKLGLYTLNPLINTIVSIQSFSERLNFCSEDKTFISSFLCDIQSTIESKRFEEFSISATRKIQQIKMIIDKGEYSL